jgi:hypothetical protein
MFQAKVVEGIKTHILCSITVFEKCVVYVRIWRNIVERGRPQIAIWRMRIACWIIKASDTHTGCAIFYDFPLQQWLHGRASMLRLLLLLLLLLLLTVNGFIPGAVCYNARQDKTIQSSTIHYNTITLMTHNNTHIRTLSVVLYLF